MKERLAAVGAWLGRHYDKLLAGAAVVVLVVSGLLYVRNGQVITIKERESNQRSSKLEPKHPEAPGLDTTEFDEAVRKHENQDQISLDGMTLFRPEKRYTCHDCRRPRPLPEPGSDPMQNLCPFCIVPEPIPIEEPDFDDDGMLDKWETTHGLDPGDPADAGHDPDKDGFTNLEEHNAEPQTTPKDLESHPPILHKLTVHRLGRVPLNLTFQGSTQVRDEKPRVSINRGRQTYFKYIGDTLFGFTLKKLVRKKTERPISPGSPTMIEVDVSELTLEKDGEEFILIKGRPETQFIYYADMKFKIDGSLYEKLFKNAEFELGPKSRYKGRKFKVISIDRQKKRILIQDGKTGREHWFEERP